MTGRLFDPQITISSNENQRSQYENGSLITITKINMVLLSETQVTKTTINDTVMDTFTRAILPKLLSPKSQNKDAIWTEDQRVRQGEEVDDEPNPGPVVLYGFLEGAPGVGAVGADRVQESLDQDCVGANRAVCVHEPVGLRWRQLLRPGVRGQAEQRDQRGRTQQGGKG